MILRYNARQIERRDLMDTYDEATQEEEPRSGLPPIWLAVGAVTIIVLGLLTYGLFFRSSAVIAPGSPVPDFQLGTFDGGRVALSQSAGEVLVINFFASWCDPCRQEAADVEAVWRRFRDQGVQFVGISYKDAESRSVEFLEEFGISYPSAPDPGNRTARAYGVTGVPETFVINGQGQLVRHFIGPVTEAQLSVELESLLNE
jgi:cytochrome c biogenesis protein CcmG/thiol:disulfide interchange protein DsbE